MSLTRAEVDLGVEYGEVFTRRWVVDFILDLVGYTADRDLSDVVIVEPSCGSGAFLCPIVDRLVRSALRHERPLDELGEAIRAFDLLDANAQLARKSTSLRLQQAGLDSTAAERLSTAWITTGDFLLQPLEEPFADFVVGNPPYIRLESVSADRMTAYRERCPTMRGRADVYVGFFEMGLSLLRPQGVLGFICADRWMRNQYGADLRQLIGDAYAVESVVTMHDVDAFEDDVSAYPAVVTLRSGPQRSPAVTEARAGFDAVSAERVVSWSAGSDRPDLADPAFDSSRLASWFSGRDLWPTGSPARLALLADLEARFPPLQDPQTGTRVGIGVATGCDEIYITANSNLVESDRLVPLMRARDLTDGQPNWSGSYLVNPWDNGGLVRLEDYPRLRHYLMEHEDRLRDRHVARKNPNRWFRTIDRVHPDLLGRPKLVLPDMKASAHPVLDNGRFYPHHNLYFVLSESWDLEVLGGLLLSDVANLFVGAYCVKMRGGCYRFQAQYLRRIRVPAQRDLDAVTAADLAMAFRARDTEWATAAALRAYDIHELPAR